MLFGKEIRVGTLDQNFLATVTLANGVSFEATSFFPESVFINDLPLYYGKSNMNEAICKDSALDRNKVARKVVICDSYRLNVSQQIMELERVGAYAEIFLTDKSSGPNKFSIPSLIFPIAIGTLIKEYVTRAKNPRVKHMKFALTRLGAKPTPQVVDFSSRGPSKTSPGVDILAAFPTNKLLMKVNNYDLVTDYALKSGTSKAKPHVAGVGALLKAVHREWSLAAIRSAMMTTAYTKDNTGTIIKSQLTNSSASPLEFGAGHIDPNKAMDPGLIYDMGLQDYIEFVWGLGYTKEQMSAVIRRTHWSCYNKSICDLNYPSFMAVLTNKTRYPVTMNFRREVTNVGNDTAVYRAHLENIPRGMRISVKPRTLTFTRKYQNRSFVVGIELDGEFPFPMVKFGFLKWIDEDSHIVSSPIVAINF